MRTDPTPIRVTKHGGSLCLVLVKNVRDQIPWRAGDFVAVRICGEKLIAERVPLESMAKIRTGEVETHAATLFDR